MSSRLKFHITKKMKRLLIIALLSIVSTTQAQSEKFDQVLKTYVDSKGNVNYQGLKKDQKALNDYLIYLENTSPLKNWSEYKEKAFWINAYNAYTLKIILDNHPLKSITDISNKGKTAWKTCFAKVGGKTYTLDDIEHEILRKKFKDPKIHVGVNCASISCPKLANFAFTEENIETELETLMKDFINDSTRNKLDSKKIQISEIFNWFKDDFTSDGTVIDYINQYSETKVNKKARIKYLNYNWSLNGK